MWRYIGLVLVGAVIFLVVINVLRQFIGDGLTSLIWLAIVIAAVVVVARNLMSNRKVSDAAPEARTQALAFTPDAGKAALYVLRTQFVGKAVGVNVEVDGKAVAQLKSPRFTRILLSPGAHRLSGYTGPVGGRKPGGELDLNVTAGEIIAATCAVEPGIVGTITKFNRVELATIRDKLAKTRMVQPDLGEV